MGQYTLNVSRCDWCALEVKGVHSCRSDNEPPRMWKWVEGQLLCPQCQDARADALSAAQDARAKVFR